MFDFAENIIKFVGWKMNIEKNLIFHIINN